MSVSAFRFLYHRLNKRFTDMFGSSLCVPQSTSYSFASTISTCCSAWAWDHERHITAYDLIMFLLITLYIKTAYLSCYVGLFLKKGLGDCFANPHPLYSSSACPKSKSPSTISSIRFFSLLNSPSSSSMLPK